MNKKYYTIKLRVAAGFIMIETIVAISVLMLAVPAALTIATKSVTLATYSRDQVIATYLAQEGLEIVRNRRDQNALRIAQGFTGIQWDEGFDPGTCAPQCRVDYGVAPATDPLIEKCNGACSNVLNKDVDGSYSHGAGDATPFSRSVITSNVPGSPDERRITSTVTYNNHGILKTIALTENITGWLQ